MTKQLGMHQPRLWARKALCVLLSGAFCLPAVPVFGQEPAALGNDNTDFQPRRIPPAQAALMSKEELTKIRFLNMLRTNPEIVTSRINVNASQFIEDGARAAYFPRITVGANASSSSTVTNRQSTDVTVTQPIYTAGRITARVKAAETDGTIADNGPAL